MTKQCASPILKIKIGKKQSKGKMPLSTVFQLYHGGQFQ
jgi:hypothetical protein